VQIMKAYSGVEIHSF